MVKKRVNLDNEDLWNIVTKTIIPKISDKISPVNFLIGDTNKKINKFESNSKNKKFHSQNSLQPTVKTLKVVKIQTPKPKNLPNKPPLKNPINGKKTIKKSIKL